MEKKILSFNDPPPNVKSNPLPDHGAVNAIDASSEENSILDVAQIKTPLKAFHSKLFKAGLVSVSHIGCTSCKGCDKGCVMVRKDVQRLIDDGFLQVVNQAKEVAAIEPTFNLPESRGRIPMFNLPAPNSVMPVFSIPTPVTPTVDQPKPLIIQKPSPFLFSDPKAVPWNDSQDCRDIPDILQVISILGDPSSMGSSVPQRNCLTCLRKYFPGILPPGMSVEFSPEAEVLFPGSCYVVSMKLPNSTSSPRSGYLFYPRKSLILRVLWLTMVHDSYPPTGSPDIVCSCIGQRSPVEIVISYSPVKSYHIPMWKSRYSLPREVIL
ncbi:hypothetical protein KIW84_076349 [Lathyrus oleraceus]|uniref:Uncharacterized protein n=1 Tax=Pisum sativum TaxID=3888 RepID=A0A9D4VWB6_PEA|nr:hypothetical protein KIW84_076349 [Pisum sativum]